jgi:hypothetical protein
MSTKVIRSQETISKESNAGKAATHANLLAPVDMAYELRKDEIFAKKLASLLRNWRIVENRPSKITAFQQPQLLHVLSVAAGHAIDEVWGYHPFLSAHADSNGIMFPLLDELFATNAPKAELKRVAKQLTVTGDKAILGAVKAYIAQKPHFGDKDLEEIGVSIPAGVKAQREQAHKAEKLQAENAQLKSEFETMKAQLAMLMQQGALTVAPTVEPTKVPRKRQSAKA